METASNNKFQTIESSENAAHENAVHQNSVHENTVHENAVHQNSVHENALAEFDNFVAVLKQNDILVHVIDDTLEPVTPDSIFPNNWISLHEDGSVFLYPMFSENRRSERRHDIIDYLKQKYQVAHQSDLSFYEQMGQFLEGTGSMVLDRDHKIAYACMSIRTEAEVLSQFCGLTGYRPITFHAVDESNYPIYHTNVMMCVGTKFVLICSESIPDIHERNYVLKAIQQSGKEIIEISLSQMNQFAGNMLEVKNLKNEPCIVMSEQAYKALNPDQVATLQSFGTIIHAPLYTIEKNGGGSARCMLAEIHLPLK